MKAKMLSQTTKMKFPAGRYFVGDPCYCFDSESWTEIGRQSNDFNNFTIMAELGDYTMWSEGTKYGDGEYTDQYNNRYSVDAGLIGVVPEELWEDKGYDLSELGKVVDFEHDFTVESDGNGYFDIGYIRIDTDEPYEAEDQW